MDGLYPNEMNSRSATFEEFFVFLSENIDLYCPLTHLLKVKKDDFYGLG